MHRERFAPSPTGYLHLGHAYSALLAWERSLDFGGEFCLRIEDLDFIRSRKEFTSAIFDDLHQLGLEWVEPVVYQSMRTGAYKQSLQKLINLGICYPCKCSRKDIQLAIEAPHNQNTKATLPQIYQGTCRDRKMSEMGSNEAIRINMGKVIDLFGGVSRFPKLEFQDIGDQFPGTYSLEPEALIDYHGDFVIARGDLGVSYHLAVVIDDDYMRISHITRGADIFSVAPIHRLLQELFGLRIPIWNHHKIICDSKGKRLAKRHNAMSLRTLWGKGWTNVSIRESLGLNQSNCQN